MDADAASIADSDPMTVTAASHRPLASAAPAPEHPTLCAAFGAAVRAHPDRLALRTPGDGVRVTWAEYFARTQDVAARLGALGVRHGDTVALLLTTRPDAAWVDAAAMHLGALGVSLYLAADVAAHAYVLNDAEARLLVTERALAPMVPELRRRCQMLEHVLGIDGDAPGVTALESVDRRPGFDLNAAADAVDADDRVTLMYTSGTTGAPKGTVYTHRQVLTAFACLDAALVPPEDLATVAFIPFAHAGQRAIGHYRAMLRGASTTFCADLTELPAAVADARPTSLFAPPAVWQRLAAGVHAVVDADPELRDAYTAALARVRHRRAGGPPFQLTPGEDRLLCAARARVGLDRLTEPYVSAAPSPPELLEDLHALGMPVINVYALTELPPITVTRPDPADIGTAGRPLPGVEVDLGPDGEVLVRHPAASSGYHRRPAKTAALFAADGWAHTGDLGTFDPAGRLQLDGRRDERFATSFGTNVDPVLVETALKGTTAPIAHACVIGAGRPFLVALITLQPGTASRDLLAAAVERVNAGLPATARIARFLVLEDTWAPGSDELTPTLKLRRSAVHARYAEQIEALYR